MSQVLGQPHGPHQKIAVEHARDRFTTLLFDHLWSDYRQRVSYVQMYEQVLRMYEGKFVNDHIAFRTLATQHPSTGIHTLGRIFTALGYRPAGAYAFEDKHLSAVHFQHANPEFPKLFISELNTWEFPSATRSLLLDTVQSHSEPLSEGFLESLHRITAEKEFAPLLERLVGYFSDLPWRLPEKDHLLSVNAASQYGAWVMVHGYRVNHFTSLINSHQVEALDEIEKTVAVLRSAGVPMKAEIEGAVDSALRQTATEAVVLNVPVLDHGVPTTIPWTYAYFELAQRDWQVDPNTNRRYRFEGFLGSQATNLFEMTKL
jgi:Domain of unknown function (DUF1338)